MDVLWLCALPLPYFSARQHFLRWPLVRLSSWKRFPLYFAVFYRLSHFRARSPGCCFRDRQCLFRARSPLCCFRDRQCPFRARSSSH